MSVFDQFVGLALKELKMTKLLSDIQTLNESRLGPDFTP